MSPPRLYISHDGVLDWLMAYEFGRVDDAQPPEHWSGISEHFGFLHDAPGGRVVGFKVLAFSEFDPEDPAVEEIWSGDRFDAPLLGLQNASAGEIVIAARTHFDGRSSLNRELFQVATHLTGQEALAVWRQCLEAGDPMAHFALGYTLFELDDAAGAYGHLRHYTEIAPHGSWNWCWYGRAAEAVGEHTEARRAYRRAVELTEAGDQETDAAERLAAMPAAAQPSDRPTGGQRAVPNRVALWGERLPQLGRTRIEALSPRAAAGLTAGALKKGYAHTDPNEDVVALLERADATIIVCADGHNGATSSRVAAEVALGRLETAGSAGDLGDDELIDLWVEINERVVQEARSAGQPESRTTLIVAVITASSLRWAAMGDSLLAIVSPDGGVRYLSQPKSHFVGWPMTRDEVAERLPRGREPLDESSWVIAATDGLTDFVNGLTNTLAGATVNQTGATRVVERLIAGACAGGAGDNVAVAAVRGAVVARGSSVTSANAASRIRGCLLGGAVGDALGAAIEFESIDRIRKRFGPNGLTDLETAYGHRGAITDDTQMTLFTAEGLMRAYVRAELRGICHIAGVVDHAYARWLATQGETSGRWRPAEFDGWLFTVGGLHSRRAPGNTCISALRADRMGTIEEPLNDSKGCGGVMRIAPAGLLGPRYNGEPFDLGCEIAALTHGHPSGYLAAGAFASLVHLITAQDLSLQSALDVVIGQLRQQPRHEETVQALETARQLPGLGLPPSAAIAALGEGWVAEEALAIGVYCALVAEDFEHGVLLAVNHSGDSDSTGSIAGNLLGAMLGHEAIPERWLEQLELAGVIERLCEDWIALLYTEPQIELEDNEQWWDRYPGW